MTSMAANRQSTGDSISWPFRIMRGFRRLVLDIENMFSYGLANFPGTRSSSQPPTYQEPLYRPKKNQLTKPYQRNGQAGGWRRKTSLEKKTTSWPSFGERSWTDKRIKTRKDKKGDKITVSNYWKVFPSFSTSSIHQAKKRTFHWREDPARSNRRAGGRQDLSPIIKQGQNKSQINKVPWDPGSHKM